MILEKINNSCIYYTEEQPIHTREYYNYCTSLLKKYLYNNDNINIIFGDYDYNFDNDNKIFKVQIQFEHTLVKQGGRGLNGEPKGKIAIDDDFYHVRIADFNKLNKFDVVIDYSMPNIENISSCELFKDYSLKTTYISPILYEYNDVKISNRDIKCVTLFYNIYEPRRKKLLDNIHLKKIESQNITNCFSSEDIKDLYSRTKVLLNIRQTDHHHTFEELRVLPALLNGVIVISEDVPLRDKIPYNEFIIWCKYDDILDKLKEVEDNYEYYWNSIFSGDKLYKTIEKMKLDNQNNIFDIINKNKNYMKKGVIFFHQAWTDFINSISLVKHYNKSYDKLILIISSNLKKNVDFFIKNTNNIDVIYVEQEILDKENNGSLYLLDYLKETLEIELDDYDLLIHGFPDHYRKDEYKSIYPKLFNTEHFVKGFYTHYGIDYLNRVNCFEFERDDESENIFYNDFIEKYGDNYILYNEDPQRNSGRGLNMVRKEGINYINLTGLADNIFITIKVLENAKELHLIDSVWASFCYMIDAKYNLFTEKNIFLYRLVGRPGGCLPNHKVTILEPISLPNWNIVDFY
jgi:hypothetical protein